MWTNTEDSLRTLKKTKKHSVGLIGKAWSLCVESVVTLARVIISWSWTLLGVCGLQTKALEFCRDYRGWILFFVALPISFVMDQYQRLRTVYYVHFVALPLLHEERVKEVQRQVREWNKQGCRGSKLMCTARAPTATVSVRTASFKSKCFPVDCFLTDVLSIDEERMIVRTEPLVNMGYMTQFLLPKGYALAIQVEMEELTIGGLAMGVGMETNSHRLGLVHENIVAYDIVLADGELVHATADNEYKDLFHALPWSHGTLGFCVALEVKIVRVKPYMHVRYIPCHTQEGYCQKLKELAEAADTPEFLEATIYSKDSAMIMCGEFADVTTRQQRAKVNNIATWYKPWYYKHVANLLERNEVYDEYIPLKQYYHRYTVSEIYRYSNNDEQPNSVHFSLSTFLRACVFGSDPCFGRLNTSFHSAIRLGTDTCLDGLVRLKFRC
jgi:Delta24-sterol reductase